MYSLTQTRLYLDHCDVR